MDLLGLNKVKEYLIAEDSQYPYEDPLSIIQVCGRVTWIELSILSNLNSDKLQFLRQHPDCTVDDPYIWYTKVFNKVIQEIKLPCHLGDVSKSSCISKRLISSHFSSNFQWQDMVFDINIVDFIVQHSKVSDNPHQFQQTFQLTLQQTSELKEKLLEHTLLESLKEKAFVNGLHESVIPISSLLAVSPKNVDELLEQHNYVKLTNSYVTDTFIQATLTKIKAQVHKFGFVTSPFEIPEIESICKLGNISLVSHNNHYFHSNFYQDCLNFCKYAPICHKLDPLAILNNRGIPFKTQNKSKMNGKSNALVTLSYYYLNEISKLKVRPGLFLDSTNNKLMQILLKGVQQDYLLPILQMENIPDYDNLAELVQEPAASLRIEEILIILDKMQLQMNNEEFIRYIKTSIYLQWDGSVSDVTCFHLMMNWEFIKMKSFVYIRAVDIPEIVKHMTVEVQDICNKLMATGQLENRKALEEKINYFY